MDKIIGISETRTKLPKIIKEVSAGKRYIITQRSKPRAVMVSLEEFETLEILADKKLLKALLASKEDIKNKRYKSYKEFFGEDNEV
jgi:prevent-host-death family protein